MGINLIIREFKNSVIKTINDYALPIEVKRLSLAEIMMELSTKAEEQIQEEVRQEQESKKEIQRESETEEIDG